MAPENDLSDLLTFSLRQATSKLSSDGRIGILVLLTSEQAVLQPCSTTLWLVEPNGAPGGNRTREYWFCSLVDFDFSKINHLSGKPHTQKPVNLLSRTFSMG